VFDFLVVGWGREGGCSIWNAMALWGAGKQSGFPRLAPNGLGGIRSGSVALAERLQALFGILANCPAEGLVTMGFSWLRSLLRVSSRFSVLPP
jgi:hypothetical protein